MTMPDMESPSDFIVELEREIGNAEHTYGNPKLDELLRGAVTLAVQGEDSLEVEVQIEMMNPPREWILLQAYKAHMGKAGLYQKFGEDSLRHSELGAALICAKAINGSRDFESNTIPLAALSTELHYAVENFAFIQQNMLKTSLTLS